MTLAHAKAKLKEWKAKQARARRRVAAWNRKVKALTLVPGRLLDVSNLQGLIDFEKVKAAGVDGVFVKVSEGADWADPKCLTNVKAARAAGLKVGGYHFLRPKPGRTGGAEAKWFAERLRAAGLGKGDLRPALDVEVTTLGPADTMAYVGQAVAALRALGHDPIIYTFPAFARWSRTFGCDLWIAHFDVKAPTIPEPWKGYVMWQHSSSGRVAGISSKVDLDVTPDLRQLIAK